MNLVTKCPQAIKHFRPHSPHHVYFFVGLYKESSFLLKRERLAKVFVLWLAVLHFPLREVAARFLC